MAGAAAAASSLATWLVAECMPVACDDHHRRRPPAMRPWVSARSRRRGRKPAPAAVSGGGGRVSELCGSGIEGLVRSCLDFQPCAELYSSRSRTTTLFGDNGGRGLPTLRSGKAARSAAASEKAMPFVLEPAKPDGEKKHADQRRVVVTGMGVVTPLGHDPDVFYNNLLEGVSAISEIETFDCSSYPTRIAGEIKSFSTDGCVSPKFTNRMDKFMLYILTAGKKALENGGVTKEIMSGIDKTRCGVLIGSAMGGMKVINDAVEALRISYRKVNPFCVPFASTNMGSAMLAMDLGWMGPNYSISTASATSNFCILNSANHIIRGEADMMLCGGSDAAIIPIGLGGFVACKALSQRNDDPTKASRPWDVDRDGFVIGEGAGVLLLEELEHAKQRGANIYAEFLGGSFSCDAYHVTEPHPEGKGIILCIEKALQVSRVAREDINYVNAHATSTPAGDIQEYRALIHCFGQNPELRVNSTKSMIGHLLGASGAVEAVAAVQAIRTGWIHPNINLDNPEKSVDVNLLAGTKKERLDIKVALSNSFGFGGHNSSILFAAYKQETSSAGSVLQAADQVLKNVTYQILMIPNNSDLNS